ncbi:glutathione S-transferase family protein [Atopomonas sediminilitoris]|uniref:glutathione S-transferase family protein n=1 Tax=Atopomonas sediminilitoris TaxID=2919919 RepID=UPI001F4EBAD6|nr:glutathione S-transferase family protein [Atopomonas sediminilitoris]MCJ8169943.1 glutathione S-transferase family protein [Atopomonas sediminilitoris]
MITLYQFPAAFGLPNPSAFCLKLETFLRLAGLEYQVKSLHDPRVAPKAKFPMIDLEGQRLADSALIQQALTERFKLTLDDQRSLEQLGHDMALTRLLDEHLYWIVVRFRWLDDECWSRLCPQFFGHLPLPLKWLVPQVARAQVKRDLHGQGLGRHSPAELIQFARADLTACAAILGSAEYFGGSAPSSVDACAYGHLANLFISTFDTPLSALAPEYPSLVAYCRRMQARLWP